MHLRLAALKSSALLSGGEVAAQGCSFVRNMILARLLTKADFGVAATLTMIVMLLEFSAKLGLGTFVVRDKAGDEPALLETVHFINLLASALSALAILAFAWPIANVLGLRQHLPAIFCLAIIPLLHGCTHLDIRRFERHLRFGPTILVDTAPQIAMTLLAWPVAAWLRDYRAVLVLMIAKVFLSWAMAALAAERPYRLALHRDHAARMLRFGWPLVVNGFMVFLMVRGDQFVVATFYSMANLGAYAAAASITMAPIFLFRRVFGSVLLPILARDQGDATKFRYRYKTVLACVCAFSTLYAVVSIMAAEAIMRLVFGEKYAGSGSILAVLSAAVAIRNIRLAPTLSALAKGDSLNQMLSNGAAGAGLAVAIVIARAGWPVHLVAFSSVVGESLACLASFRRLKLRDGISQRESLPPTFLVVVCIALASSFWMTGVQDHNALFVIGISLVAGVLCSAAVVLALPASRREVFRALEYLRQACRRGKKSHLADDRRAHSHLPPDNP